MKERAKSFPKLYCFVNKVQYAGSKEREKMKGRKVQNLLCVS